MNDILKISKSIYIDNLLSKPFSGSLVDILLAEKMFHLGKKFYYYYYLLYMEKVFEQLSELFIYDGFFLSNHRETFHLYSFIKTFLRGLLEFVNAFRRNLDFRVKNNTEVMFCYSWNFFFK